jgi:superfamily I DNA and/or RNA helicase
LRSVSADVFGTSWVWYSLLQTLTCAAAAAAQLTVATNPSDAFAAVSRVVLLLLPLLLPSCRHFNVVVIDEATQATEPATLVPLTQGAQCAVMAGDPCQLPPTIISREAYKFDLDVTLFDRLQQGVGLAPLLLDTQYRMNPAISCFPR